MNKKSYIYGVNAELEAKKFLINKNFIFIQSRFKTPYGEIDLIMKDVTTIVFIEVKFRKFNILESISFKQKERIKNASLYFLSINENTLFEEIRFDAILITPSLHVPFFKINHIQSAWI